jgi:regulator of protease activity HflC (stomatin/prohibitin superfamily)
MGEIDLTEMRFVPLVCCSLCCFASIFGIIALPLSFSSLEQGKYALELSWTTQKVGNEVLKEPGLYRVGLGNMLIQYPSTFQTMYFVSDKSGITEEDDEEVHQSIQRGPIYARTKDGLEMSVSCSFQWQLQPDSLKPLYEILGGGTLEESYYRDEFVRFARAAIVEACTKFEADEFFRYRVQITDHMLNHVRAAFQDPARGLHLTISGLQLREVDLPNEFDVELVKTQEEMQEVLVALAEREEEKTKMEKDLEVAEKNLEQVEQEALGAAEQTRLTNEARVTQLLILAQKQADANAEILKMFVNDTDPYARLFEVMELRALSSHDSTKMLINL